MTMTQDKPLTAPEYIEFAHIAAEMVRSNSDQTQHLFCIRCNPVPRAGIPALCGAPRPHGRPFRLVPDTESLCVVCDDLVSVPCKKCGAP